MDPNADPGTTTRQDGPAEPASAPVPAPAPEPRPLRGAHLAWARVIRPAQRPSPLEPDNLDAETTAVSPVPAPALPSLLPERPPVEAPPSPAAPQPPAPVAWESPAEVRETIPIRTTQPPARRPARPEVVAPEGVGSPLGRLVALIVSLGLAWALTVAVAVWLIALLLAR